MVLASAKRHPVMVDRLVLKKIATAAGLYFALIASHLAEKFEAAAPYQPTREDNAFHLGNGFQLPRRVFMFVE